MATICWLNKLPVEILYSLFTYFSAHEILLIFSDISAYMNAVICSYPEHRLDLSQIRKSDLKLIHRFIAPEKVIALTISDDNKTHVLSELFLSHFRIEQFIQLRSLKLVQIEINSLKMIVSDLYQLDQLRTFSFNIESIRHRFPAWKNGYSNEFNELKSYLVQNYARLSPQLNRLCLNSSNELLSISLPSLRRLKITRCILDELQVVLENLPELRSLDVSLDGSTSNLIMALPPNQLTWLNIELKSKCKIYLISRCTRGKIDHHF